MEDLIEKIALVIEENSNGYVYISKKDTKKIALKILELLNLKAIPVQAKVKVDFAEKIIEEEIKKLEKLANEFMENGDTEGYIINLNDSNILHRVLIRLKTERTIYDN